MLDATWSISVCQCTGYRSYGLNHSVLARERSIIGGDFNCLLCCRVESLVDRDVWVSLLHGLRSVFNIPDILPNGVVLVIVNLFGIRG